MLKDISMMVMMINQDEVEDNPTTTDNRVIKHRTIDINNVHVESTPTSTGVMTFTSREDDIRRKTTKFIMENKTIFEELSKL